MKKYLFALFCLLEGGLFSQKSFCVEWIESESDSMGKISKKSVKTRRYCYDKNGNTTKKYFYKSNLDDPGKEKTIVFDHFGLDSLYFVTKPNGDYIKSFFNRDQVGDIISFKTIEKRNSKIDTTVFYFENKYNRDSTMRTSVMRLRNDSNAVNTVTYEYFMKKIVKKSTDITVEGEHRLTEVEFNKYDGDGNLIEKSINDQISNKIQTWRYVYKDKLLAKESYSSSGSRGYEIDYLYVGAKMKSATRIDYPTKKKRLTRFKY